MSSLPPTTTKTGTCPKTQYQQSKDSLENALETLVIQIWDKYDEDGNGLLNKEEAQKFVNDILNDITPGQCIQAANEPTTPDGFDEVFSKIDINGDGAVSQNEMLVYFKFLGGLDNQ